jgi:hypothetical protein
MRSWLILGVEVISIVLTIIGLGSPAIAANQCVDFFDESSRVPEKIVKLNDLIDKDLMKKHSFRVGPGNQLIDLSNNNKVIGELSLVDAPFLYEWASKSYHKIWVGNGGIDKNEMTEIIKEPAQVGGKGYYVSTDPVDSETFGNALTVFKANGPLLVIQKNNYVVTAPTEFVMRMQGAGIEAIQMTNFRSTWLSVISAKHLKIPKKMKINDTFWSDVKSIDRALSIFPKLGSDFFNQLDKSSPFYFLTYLKNKMPFQVDEINSTIVFKLLRKKLLPPTRNLIAPLASYHASRINQQKPYTVDSFSELMSSYYYIPEFATGLKKELQKPSTPASNIYSAIPKYFDIKTLVFLAQGKKIKGIQSFERVKEMSAKLEVAKKQIDLKSIETFKDFLNACRIILGESPQFRTNEVVMTSEKFNSKENFRILTSRFSMEILLKNRLLTLEEMKTSKDILQQSAMISYFSFKKLAQSANQLPLSRSLKTNLGKYKDLKDGDELDKNAQELYAQGLEELTKKLFSDVEGQNKIISYATNIKRPPDSIPTALELYTIFMALHPLSDGNGRVGRLFFDILNAKEASKSDGLIIPIFDLDLMVSKEELPAYLKYSEIINFYLSKSVDDQDFLNRARTALDSLIKLIPNLQFTFPELK